MKKNAGFTIIEIVVVLIVMSIIVAFALGRGRVLRATNLNVRGQSETGSP